MRSFRFWTGGGREVGLHMRINIIENEADYCSLLCTPSLRGEFYAQRKCIDQYLMRELCSQIHQYVFLWHNDLELNEYLINSGHVVSSL